MKSKQLLFVLLAMFFCSTTMLKAQEQEVDHSYKPLKLSLNEDGSKYVRFIMWHQIWATTNNLSNDSDFSVTPSIRRSRFLAFAQISPKFLILTHWGLNGLTPNNLTSLGNNGNAPQLFLHDAWGEYKIADELYIGGGLHYWKGMTRLANQSTLNFMTMDQSRPFVHWHSLGNTDQFARHLGFYAKGTLGDKFQYRLAVNQRMNPNNALRGGTSYNGDTTVSMTGSGQGIVEGYFEYQLWDKESNKLPYKVGTYMGKKKVLNIGAGFFTNPNGALNNVTGNDQNVMHFAGDVFLELPTENGALNAYASVMRFNYGEDFVGRWAGTGTNFYTHLGYYIKSAKLMPYVSYQMGNYDGLSEGAFANLDDNVQALNIGANYYINGHFAKATLEYHSILNQLSGAGDVSQMRLQLHFFL